MTEKGGRLIVALIHVQVPRLQQLRQGQITDHRMSMFKVAFLDGLEDARGRIQASQEI